MEIKNFGLEKEVALFKNEMSTQDQEIRLLKNEIFELKSLLPQKVASYHAADKVELKSSKKNSRRRSDKALSQEIPSSCDDLLVNGNYANGIYLVKKDENKNIEAVFCKFSGVNDGKIKKIYF